MSGDCETLYCLDCKEYTGSGQRVVGFPSLSEEKKTQCDPSDEWMYQGRFNFGFLKKGLDAFKMNTEGLETYFAFLKKHDGHNVVLGSGWCEDYIECKAFEYATNDMIEAYYEIKCHDCDTATLLDRDEPIRIRQFDEFEVTKEKLELFKQYALHNYKTFDDLYMNYLEAFDLLFEMDSIDELACFLEAHSGHKLSIRLSIG